MRWVLGSPVLFADAFFIACAFPGDSHIAHADNELENMEGVSLITTQQQAYTGLAYLNDHFRGELVFQYRDVVIIRKPGLSVGFPSSNEFVHAVSKVRAGKRYCLPTWFSVDSAKAMQV